MTSKTYRIGVMGGDGTGPEVVREGIKVLEVGGAESMVSARLGELRPGRASATSARARSCRRRESLN